MVVVPLFILCVCCGLVSCLTNSWTKADFPAPEMPPRKITGDCSNNDTVEDSWLSCVVGSSKGLSSSFSSLSSSSPKRS